MQVKFCVFAKKPNSTKIPGATITWYEYNCMLKDTCSVLNPVLEVRLTSTHADSPITFNYCYIPLFERYYYINDWVFSDNLWIAQLTVDPLASWKVSIGLSRQYVTRTSTDEYNPYITDHLYTTHFPTTSNYQWSDPFAHELGNGSFILGIKGQLPDGLGTTYYVFDLISFNYFVRYLWSQDFLDLLNIEDVTTNLVKGLIDPLQYISSCYWYPVPITALVPDPHYIPSIKFGWWDVPIHPESIRVKSLGNTPAYQSPVITEVLPLHPQSNERGRYLEFSPYTYMRLKFPYFPEIELDTTFTVRKHDIPAEGRSTISYHVVIDLVTGESRLILATPKGTMATITSNCSIPVQLSQASRNPVERYTTIASQYGRVANAITSNIGEVEPDAGMPYLPTNNPSIPHLVARKGISSIIPTIVSSVGNVIQASMPHIESAGYTGDFTEIIFRPLLTAVFYEVVTADFENHGRPLCQIWQVSTLGGFMVCTTPHLECSATLEELSDIYTAMEKGFYYE